MQQLVYLAAFWLAALLGAAPVQAVTYYVDFLSGNDHNSGRGMQEAWQHCPGDPAAAAQAASARLQPGDIVLFKGGIEYSGMVAINASGEEGRPITFKGNGWGEEKARIDGASLWSANWKVCPTREFAKDNSNFAHIYFAEAPEAYIDFRNGLFEDGDFMWYAQGPDLRDPFYYDDIYQYHQIELNSAQRQQTRTSITDHAILDQSEADFWNGAHVATWVQGNLVAIQPVTNFDPAQHTIRHADLGQEPYRDRAGYYSLLNHVALISRPGEYAYDSDRKIIFLQPKIAGDAKLHEYKVQIRETAFSLTSHSHITIEGFVIQHFSQAVHADNTAATGVHILGNDISKLCCRNKYAIFVNASHSLVAKNRVWDCQRGVGILSSATDIAIRDNYVSRTSRQGIWLMGAKHSLVCNNILADIRGSHSNALSIYSGSTDILVAHNSIYNASSPITFEDSQNLTFFGNQVDCGGRGYAAADWFGSRGRIVFVNNTLVNSPHTNSLLVAQPGAAEYVFINNIMTGGGPASSSHDYNLFLQSPAWTLALHEELQPDADLVFRSAATADWHLKAGSPAVDSGTNPLTVLPLAEFPDFDFLRDPDGRLRGENTAWDRGAYEFSSGRSK